MNLLELQRFVSNSIFIKGFSYVNRSTEKILNSSNFHVVFYSLDYNFIALRTYTHTIPTSNINHLHKYIHVKRHENWEQSRVLSTTVELRNPCVVYRRVLKLSLFSNKIIKILHLRLLWKRYRELHCENLWNDRGRLPCTNSHRNTCVGSEKNKKWVNWNGWHKHRDHLKCSCWIDLW